MTTQKTFVRAAASCAALFLLLSGCVWAHDDGSTASTAKSSGTRTNAAIVQSQPGDNAWNAGRPVEDWWGEIKRQHEPVGPWNVLGWRIGQAALREFKSDRPKHAKP